MSFCCITNFICFLYKNNWVTTSHLERVPIFQSWLVTHVFFILSLWLYRIWLTWLVVNEPVPQAQVQNPDLKKECLLIVVSWHLEMLFPNYQRPQWGMFVYHTKYFSSACTITWLPANHSVSTQSLDHMLNLIMQRSEIVPIMLQILITIAV